ncbi:MAG: MBL fold metallo-hydrolase [Archaeoglobaceae archaeon]|nr:MBL fold metallo-hydrolase [Archaeoglobaceae archaeon]MDW7990068.1 MBL fold metallo-hydrolase [Archaeoglobaceae archaeon]
MIKKIEEGLYRIEIPLPKNPLKSINSYVLIGKRALVIDTGFNMEKCYTVLFKGLRELGIEPKKVDVLSTHLHVDHLGLSEKIARNLLMSKIDAEITVKEMLDPEYWKKIAEIYVKNGFPEVEARKVTRIHPAIKYGSKFSGEIVFLNKGEILEYGNFCLEIIFTPGHTPGHVCLYEAEKKIFFSGDHILFDITPNITFWESMKDSLGEYLRSLDKIHELEVIKTLPGHRNFKNSHKKRIEELKRHHRKRLEEALCSVKRGYNTAWEVAQHITWDLIYENWEDLPTMQKWFAVGETIAHLEHLELNGMIRKKEEELIRYLPK